MKTCKLPPFDPSIHEMRQNPQGILDKIGVPRYTKIDRTPMSIDGDDPLLKMDVITKSYFTRPMDTHNRENPS